MIELWKCLKDVNMPEADIEELAKQYMDFLIVKEIHGLQLKLKINF